MVGAGGFEPPASASRTQRSTKLSHAPDSGREYTGRLGVRGVRAFWAFGVFGSFGSTGFRTSERPNIPVIIQYISK